MRIIRKIEVVLLCGAALSLLASCDNFYYEYMRPECSATEKWVSEEPDMYFVGWDEEKRCSYGQITVNGETREIEVEFDHTNGMEVYPHPPKSEIIDGREVQDGTAWLFRGKCKFGKKKFVLTVPPEEDKENVFGGEKMVFTFVKETIPEETIPEDTAQ